MNAIRIRKIQYALNSPFVWLYMLLKGVKSNELSFFNGFPYFELHKNSSIVVAGNCKFCSRTKANPLGNKHRCMVSTLEEGALVQIGESCGFSGTTICCSSQVVLQHHVRCGANSSIIDSDGHNEDFRSSEPKRILIEDHAWLGNDSIILKGVTIGRYAMVGAGSVVRNSIPPYAVVMGNPAKVIGYSKTPEEIIEFEKQEYKKEERLPIEYLEKNYNQYFINKIKEIKSFTHLSF